MSSPRTHADEAKKHDRYHSIIPNNDAILQNINFTDEHNELSITTMFNSYICLK